jgi:hypothetical protein
MRRWATPLLAALLVLDLVVLVFGVRSRGGDLPPLQRGAGATYAAGPTSAPTTGATSDAPDGEPTIQGPLTLAANASGLVVRATRGACEPRFERSAYVWVGHLDDDAGLQQVDVPALHEVLGLVVLADGTVRISGRDDQCGPVTVVSTDEGATWETTDAADMWLLKADTTAQSVTRPNGRPLELDCPPVQVVNLQPRGAVVACNGTPGFYVASAAPVAVSIGAEGFTSLVATPKPGTTGQYYVFGSYARCVAQVATVTASSRAPVLGECLEGNRGALAIATSGTRVIVQVGEELMVSDDEGEKFITVGPASTASTSAEG